MCSVTNSSAPVQARHQVPSERFGTLRLPMFPLRSKPAALRRGIGPVHGFVTYLSKSGEVTKAAFVRHKGAGALVSGSKPTTQLGWIHSHELLLDTVRRTGQDSLIR